MTGINKNWALTILIAVTTMACSTSQTAVGQNGVSKKASALFGEGLKMQSYGEYNKAISLFKSAIKKSDGFEDAYDALAHTYQKAGNTSAAISTYRELLTINPRHPYAMYELGNIYFNLENVDSSAYFYKSFLSINKTNDKNSKKAVRALTNISFIREAKANPVDIVPINLGGNINTPEQEYSPAFAIDENTMYITRRTGNLRDSRPNEDIYLSTLKKDEWQKIRNLGPPINTVENEGAFSVSADGHYIFFTSCSRPGGKGQCDIWLTIDQEGTWSEPMNLQEPINTKYWESQPSLASNGKVLYFTSDRPGGYGGTDIWMSVFGENGWEKPINLGPDVNTSEDEQFPFIHSDNETLYFSSEGHPGMGKSDLFVTRKMPENQWETPKNLGYPINTSGYDWNMVVSRDGSTAYFSSDRMDGGYGGLDIYTFQLPKEIQAKKVSYVRGKVTDGETGKPLASTVQLTPFNSEYSTSTYTDARTGVFIVPLLANTQYALTIDKKGYLFHSENFDMPEVSVDKPYELDIKLQPVKVGNTVVLNNIFFETDKFDLKNESATELENLLNLLKANVNMAIEISGHTDNVGNAAHNMNLSKNRAQAVYDFLVNNGIDASRLTFKGYGDTQPITSNDSEAGRAKNRRTEITIVR